MKRTETIFVLATMLIALAGTSLTQSKFQVSKQTIKRLSPLFPPDTVNDSYLYGIGGFVCTEDGKLFFADHQQGAIRVFSVDEGRELYRFGKKGKGPGEFQAIGKMKLSAGKIETIDEGLLRCTFYTLTGQVTNTIPLWSRTSDVVFLGSDSMVTCTYRFDSNHKPLKIVKMSTGKVLRELGVVIDVQKGLMEKFMTMFPGNAGMYESVVISLQQLPGRNVLYSQRNPYALCIYDMESGAGKPITAFLDLDTEDKLLAEPYRGTGARFTSRPSPTILPPQIVGDYICVLIFSLDRQSNFLDCYDLSGTFVKRLKTPPLPRNSTPVGVAFRKSNEVFVLIMGDLGVMWFERYSLRLH